MELLWLLTFMCRRVRKENFLPSLVRAHSEPSRNRCRASMRSTWPSVVSLPWLSTLRSRAKAVANLVTWHRPTSIQRISAQPSIIWLLTMMNAQRTIDYKKGTYALAGGLPEIEELTDDTPQFIKEYCDFYKTPRGYHKHSVGGNGGWNVTSNPPTYRGGIFSAPIRYSINASIVKHLPLSPEGLTLQP